MVKFLIKKFIKDYERTDKPEVRRKYEILSGIMGIVCNAVLFGIKLSIGILMGSIAIMSDAFNNLSDMGTSLVTIVSAKISGKKPDKKHPFGHGRVEYIAALIVSFLIILVGFELLKTSVDKIFNPETVTYDFVLLFILTASILIKVYMFFYNRYIAKKINSHMIKATSTDSLSDCISTGAVILATFLGKLLNFPMMDGIVGTLVALLIMFNGYKITREIITTLMGTAPDPKMVSEIKETLLSQEEIHGVHDLIVHDYGPGRIIASAHVEVSDKGDIVKIHEIIDAQEEEIKEKFGILMVLHMDPISIDGSVAVEIRKLTEQIAKDVNENLSVHDLRITEGDNRINVIFDIVVPVGTDKIIEAQWLESVKTKLQEADSRYCAVINVDYDY